MMSRDRSRAVGVQHALAELTRLGFDVRPYRVAAYGRPGWASIDAVGRTHAVAWATEVFRAAVAAVEGRSRPRDLTGLSYWALVWSSRTGYGFDRLVEALTALRWAEGRPVRGFAQGERLPAVGGLRRAEGARRSRLTWVSHAASWPSGRDGSPEHRASVLRSGRRAERRLSHAMERAALAGVEF